MSFGLQLLLLICATFAPPPVLNGGMLYSNVGRSTNRREKDDLKK